MGGQAHAVGGLVAMPIAVGIVIGIVLHISGIMSDWMCAAAGTVIALPGAITTYVLLMRYLRKQDGEEQLGRQRIAR